MPSFWGRAEGKRFQQMGLVVLLLALIFLWDLFVPLGVAMGLLYVSHHGFFRRLNAPNDPKKVEIL